MQRPSDIDKFICERAITGGSELANIQSAVNGPFVLYVVMLLGKASSMPGKMIM